MNLLSLFAEVRGLYVRKLSAAVAGIDAHIEPALRNREGALAVEGPLSLPIRVDAIRRKGNGKSITVDSTSRIAFDPILTKFGQCDVRIASFTWDAVQLTVNGLKEQDVHEIAPAWFFRWFDAEDKNAANAEGLYGVVHFLGDPKVVTGGIELSIDFGSAPAEALNDLLDSLARRGAVAIHLK